MTELEKIMADANRSWSEFMKKEQEAATKLLEWLLAQPTEPIKLNSLSNK